MVNDRITKEKDAKALYLYTDMSLKDIADYLEVPDSTVRRWKRERKWEDEKKLIPASEREVKANELKIRTQKKDTPTNARPKNFNEVRRELSDETKELVEEVEELKELNEREKLFVAYYVTSFNATSSYQKAYNSTYAAAVTLGNRVRHKPKVEKAIAKLKKQRYARALLSEEDIFQKNIDIAFSNITDYVTLKTKNTLTGKMQCLELKDLNEVDGTLISEISCNERGIKIKLADKAQALKWLSDHMGMTTPEQKARIEMMKAKTTKDDKESIEDDGFLDALNTTAKEDWSEEE